MAENNLAVTKTKTAAELAQDVKANALKNTVKQTGFVGLTSVQLNRFLEREYGLQIQQLLPDCNKAKVQKVIAQAVLVISQNEALKECTPQSVIAAICKAAMYGFNPNQEMGQCWFIPYNNSYQDEQGQWQSKKECQFQMGARGWVQRVQNTGLVKRIINKAVHINDEFSEICGSKSEIIHKPCGEQVTWDTLFASYAIIEIILKDSKGRVLLDASGQPIVGIFDLVMYKPEIDRLRKMGVPKWERNKDKLLNAWVNNSGEMAKAKVLKKLIKDELPHSDEMEDMIESDEKVFDITQANMAKKGLIPVPVEENEPENVEVLEVMETQKIVENAWDGNNVVFDNIWTAIVKGEIKPEEIEYSAIDVICEKIKSGVIPYTDVPNELLSIKDIENAVFSMEQKTAIK